MMIMIIVVVECLMNKGPSLNLFYELTIHLLILFVAQTTYCAINPNSLKYFYVLYTTLTNRISLKYKRLRCLVCSQIIEKSKEHVNQENFILSLCNNFYGNSQGEGT